MLFFGGSFGVGAIFFNALWWYALRTPRLLNSRVSAHAGRLVGRRFLAGPLLTLLGAAVGAFAPAAGLAIYALMIPVFWLPLPALEPVPLGDESR
ncbi:hypothetical protein [Micromonospora sp. NPDC049102]|uniref:hypothetical protein n=1 Tax=Micromonospora sp. NPDC049102 TaxID=3364265 RepID=UPI003718F534